MAIIGIFCSSCPILLSNPTFKLINGSLFELLSHDLFVSEPRVLGLPRVADVHVGANAVIRRLGVVILASHVIIMSNVWRRHVKHNVIKLFMVAVIIVVALTTRRCAATSVSGLLSLNVDVLIVLDWHVLGDEI